MKIERFEDIEAWQAGRELTLSIYRATRLQQFAKDFGLVDQLRRAAVSITSNIAEGFERGGDKEFVHALTLAKGSCGEVRSQLYVALDEEYITKTQFDELAGQALAASRLLGGFIKYLQSSTLRGTKFRRRDDSRP
jgi:four helix bundle protein